ncbi:hypothetical protein [Phocaeicola barnesiae]|uniref:hypothetical protein n=1 Tax=Phocaeicola barnesiae TaxID=376804 RepID=UPI00243021C8|nr:hypothetical protein [Phocaeicola barnesiae]
MVRLLSQGETDASLLSKVIHGRTVKRVGRDVITAALIDVISEVDIDQSEGKRKKAESRMG